MQRPLPRGLVGPAAAGRGGNQRLAQGGAGGAGRGTEHGRVDRHFPPAEDGETVLPQHVLDDRRGARQRAWLAREEERAQRERLSGLEVDPELRRFLIEEAVGDLREQAGAVARGVGGRGTAVGHAGDGLQRQREHAVGRLARRPRHETHAAGVVLPPGVESARALARLVRPVRVVRHARSL